MTVVLKAAWLPFCFLGAFALVLSLKPAPAVLSHSISVEPSRLTGALLPATQQVSDATPSELQTTPKKSAAVAQTLANPHTTSEFKTLSHLELQQLSDAELFNYLLDFREQQGLTEDFSEQEYALFISAMRANPNVAIDYMLAAGHDSDSEFFYNFLYSDLFTNTGFGDEIVSYVNNTGANPDLIELLSLAQRAGDISLPVQQQVIAEFLQGQANYYPLLVQTDWINQLSRSELILAFNNAEPKAVEDPLALVARMVSLNEVGTYGKLLEFVEQHPNRYRIYQQVRHLAALDIENSLNQLMFSFEQLSLNDQIHSALIALEFGDDFALRFLAEQPLASLTLNYPVNAELALYRAIDSPLGLGIDLPWVRENLHYLSFNPRKKKFDY